MEGKKPPTLSLKVWGRDWEGGGRVVRRGHLLPRRFPGGFGREAWVGLWVVILGKLFIRLPHPQICKEISFGRDISEKRLGSPTTTFSTGRSAEDSTVLSRYFRTIRRSPNTVGGWTYGVEAHYSGSCGWCR